MLCQQHVIAGGSYINIGNDTFWPHEISCHIEYKSFDKNIIKHARKGKRKFRQLITYVTVPRYGFVL